VTSNILQELDVVLSMGCERVLTSGGEATALEGSHTIRRMIERTSGRITVVPGIFETKVMKGGRLRFKIYVGQYRCVYEVTKRCVSETNTFSAIVGNVHNSCLIAGGRLKSADSRALF